MAAFRLRQLLLLPAVLVFTLASAQQVAPKSPDAKTLAKYDKNKNGKLDADELATLQADEAKDAKAPATSPATNSGDVVTMSPFTVDASDDKGYSASNTLSGTRLNSKLEDIAGSISVITKQQLLDTASIDLNDIFQYEIGTEGTAQFTDPSSDGRGDYDNVSGNPTGANRMRGLSQANIMVNGFTASTSIPVDPYNLDSVEIARGSNPTLAGLSDAGGSVNLVTGRANLSRETSNFTTRYDSVGGFRLSMDLNRPLIRNKLALRFSAMYGEVGYERKPSVDRTDRQQISLTYRPFKNTVITGSFERFNEFARRANSITPRDTISIWRSRGRPTYDQSDQTFTVNGVKSAPVTTLTGTLPLGITGLGSSNARNVQFVDDGTIYFLMRGGQPNNTPAAIMQFTQSSAVPENRPLYKIPGVTDKSIYDYTDINIQAPNYEIQHAKTANVNLDQALLTGSVNRLDLQLGWRREDIFRHQRQFIAQQDGVPAILEVDTNARLVDGRPNPFFQHPFIGGLAPQAFFRPLFSDTYRAQLAYQLDLTKQKSFLKWFGQHKANGYLERRLTIQAPNGLRYHDQIVDNPDFIGAAVLNPLPTTNLSAVNGGLVYPLYYMGKTPGGGVEYANEGPVNPSGRYVGSVFVNGAWKTDAPYTLQEIYFSQAKQKKIIRTGGFAVQSFWLNNRIVTTYGSRLDRSYSQDSLPTTLTNGFMDPTNTDNFGVNKKYRDGRTESKGAVVKPFIGIPFLDRNANEGSGLSRFFAEAVRGTSFVYNTANSFKPEDTAYDLFLKELPNPTSHTKEYGIRVNMFRKFSVALTHQETFQENTRANTGTIATRALGIDFHPGGQNLTFNLFDAATSWELLANPALTTAQAQALAAPKMGFTADFINNAGGKTISDSSDAISRGYELELQFNPNRYWTNKITANQQEAIDQNISGAIQDYIAMRRPVWETIRDPSGNLWFDTRQGSNGIPRDYLTGTVIAPFNLLITSQGKKKPQTREYTFNYITRYQLAGLGAFAGDHAWLRNVSVGGSYRWASEGAIGYGEGAPDSDGVVRVLDKNKPYFDKARGNLSLTLGYRTKLFRDKIGANFQLNVNNVNESGRLQPIAVNPDGTPWNYRIVDPRLFIFTVSFDL
jgi:outer membrane receptor protein involved in Fe transport